MTKNIKSRHYFITELWNGNHNISYTTPNCVYDVPVCSCGTLEEATARLVQLRAKDEDD